VPVFRVGGCLLPGVEVVVCDSVEDAVARIASVTG
jgi:hypothetical protein